MFINNFKNPFDIKLYHFINGIPGHYPLLDQIMIFFAKDALEIYAVLFLIAWFVLPKRDISTRNSLIISGLSGILALLLNVVISHIWYRPRPFVTLHSVNQLIPHPVDASFPSDHTSGSFGFASGVFGSQKWLSFIFPGIAIIVMFARVYCGLHYPTDVIGGMIVGILAGIIMRRFTKHLLPLTTFLANRFKFGPKFQSKDHTSSH